MEGDRGPQKSRSDFWGGPGSVFWGGVALAAVLLVGCHRAEPVKAPAQGPPRTEALLEVQAPRLVGTDAQGRVRWELRAASVVVDRRQRVTAERATGYLMAEDGTRVQIQAGRAWYERGQGRVQLDGAVKVVAARRRWLTAQQATYEPATDRLRATGGVRLQVDDWSVTADLLESEPRLRRARLWGAVRVTVEAGR
jgi:LPS export ABC transporter protein LptC